MDKTERKECLEALVADLNIEATLLECEGYKLVCEFGLENEYVIHELYSDGSKRNRHADSHDYDIIMESWDNLTQTQTNAYKEKELNRFEELGII